MTGEQQALCRDRETAAQASTIASRNRGLQETAHVSFRIKENTNWFGEFAFHVSRVNVYAAGSGHSSLICSRELESAYQ